MNVSKVYTKIKVWLLCQFQKDPKESYSPYFTPLSPTDNAEECEVYLEALEWAFANPKAIKNIAITGPYGSGKSSIINTYIKKYNSSDTFLKRIRNKRTLRFLNISLATFNENQLVAHGIDHNKERNLQNLIEFGIVQQIIFHETDSKVPDSRFLKIRRNRKSKLFLYALGVLVFLNSLLFLIAPDFLTKFSLVFIPLQFAKYFDSIAKILVISGFLLFLYKISRTVISFTITKLSINKAQIEFCERIQKSVLNDFLDEIIYFFQTTDYNVVVIEDLERFQQPEVFTKLREINQILNSTRKITREIVFIYAIKDDLFLDKQRPKFFDFIIPVIPVINYSNSRDKLHNLVAKNNYKISSQLLDDISFFIDDMRLLHNIMNEFYVYSKRVDSTLNHDKLLSLIVYKNIHPRDFIRLYDNEGDLALAFAKKSEYVVELVSNYESKISALKNKISESEAAALKSVKELRVLYIAAIIEKLKKNGFLGLEIKGSDATIADYCVDEHFEIIKNGSIGYFYQRYSSKTQNTFEFEFKQIENEVDSKFTYDYREEVLINKTKINELKKALYQLGAEQETIHKKGLKDLMVANQISPIAETDKRGLLIKLLLRNGYIDENYMDYITIFHEGPLTKADYTFILNVKTGRLSDFDYELNNKEEIINRLSGSFFENDCILNFDLMDILLKKTIYTTQKRNLFKVLANESDRSLEFIHGYINRNINVGGFLKELCKHWSNIWKYISTESHYDTDIIKKYFQNILSFADVTDIKKIFEQDMNYLSDYDSILSLDVNPRKIKDIITELNIQLTYLPLLSPPELLEFVLNEYHFQININTVSTLLEYKGCFDKETFITSNYKSIIMSRVQPIIDIIEDNIDIYIEKVYLELRTNRNEDLNYYLQILNKTGINKALLERVIMQVDTVVNSIDEIKESHVQMILFKHLKVAPDWNNILTNFNLEEQKLGDGMIAYLNSPIIARALSVKRIPLDSIEGKLPFLHLTKSILSCALLGNDTFSLLAKSVPWQFENLGEFNLTEERSIALIRNRNISPSLKNYVFLKENFNGVNIMLLEYKYQYFRDKLHELEFDSDDIEIILKSKKLQRKMIYECLNHCTDETIFDNPENVKVIASILLKTNIKSIRESIKITILSQSTINEIVRVKLFNKYYRLLNKVEVINFLETLSGGYKKIADIKRKAKITDTRINSMLVENLRKTGVISSFSRRKGALYVHHRRS
jgi:hypothetical protein